MSCSARQAAAARGEQQQPRWRWRRHCQQYPASAPCSGSSSLAAPRHLRSSQRVQASCARQQDALAPELNRNAGTSTVFPQQEIAAASAAPAAPPAHLSYVQGPTDHPLLEETVGQALTRTAKAYPDSDAVVSVHQGVRLSYRQFLEQVEQVACGLLALGVQKGDRVGIWAPNCVEWVVLQFAAAKVGAILVNINPAYRAAELAYALAQSGVSLLVLAPGLKGGNGYVDTVRSVREQTPLLHRRVLLGPGPPPKGFMSWSELQAHGRGQGLAAALQRREAQLLPGDPVNIQYTSGTTGFPKAATLSHRNILNNGLFISKACGYGPSDRVCIPVPLYHCFGMVIGNMACVASGTAMVYPAEQFGAEATLAAVAAERCTSLLGVPTMFIAELALPGFRQYHLDSLRTGVMAGSPCPVEVMKRVRAEMHMQDVTICYGMTETSPVSFQTGADDPEGRRVSTVGRIHPHLEAKVVDPASSATLPRGVVGELCVRGYSVMLGYWLDEASTAAALDQDGWMHTGDLASIDTEGYCVVAGRIKDLVIRGGENIYPREVEEFLFGHPAVADVQVFGVPGKRYGEELCAWVRLREGFPGVGRAELRAWCRGQIAGFKVPRYWKFVDAFPMTVSGKPQKYKMREAAIAELGLGPATPDGRQGSCSEQQGSNAATA